MDIRDIIIRLNCQHLPKLLSNYTQDLDIKKIGIVALKILIIGSFFHYKKDAFAIGFTIGTLSKLITKKDFKFNELNRFIDQNPIGFLKATILGHIILYPADLELGATASGFYTGIGIAKLCK